MDERKNVYRQYIDELGGIWKETGLLFSEFIYGKVNKDGITKVQTMLLIYLLEKKELTISAVASYMGVTIAAVSSMVDRLVKVGLINRVRSEIDRRIVHVSLTPLGIKTAEKCVDTQNQKIEELLNIMGKENAKAYVNSQKALIEALRKII